MVKMSGMSLSPKYFIFLEQLCHLEYLEFTDSEDVDSKLSNDVWHMEIQIYSKKMWLFEF